MILPALGAAAPPWANLLTVLFVSIGSLFFLAGTVGLLRFPDVYCRLHAVAKADNLGLGFVVLGMTFQAGSWAARLQLLLTWLLVLGAAAVVCHLLARSALHHGVEAALGDDAALEAPGTDGLPPRGPFRPAADAPSGEEGG